MDTSIRILFRDKVVTFREIAERVKNSVASMKQQKIGRDGAGECSFYSLGDCFKTIEYFTVIKFLKF